MEHFWFISWPGAGGFIKAGHAWARDRKQAKNQWVFYCCFCSTSLLRVWLNKMIASKNTKWFYLVLNDVCVRGWACHFYLFVAFGVFRIKIFY